MLVRSVDYLHSPEMSNSRGPNKYNKTRARRDFLKWICRGVTWQKISTVGAGSKSDPVSEQQEDQIRGQGFKKMVPSKPSPGCAASGT